MSAWIVSKQHIALLTEAIFRYGIVTPNEGLPNDIGTMLWKENHKSVNERYHERTRTPKYRHDEATTRDTLDMVRQHILLHKQIDCYVYQTDNHAGWLKSVAHTLCKTLHSRIERTLQLNTDEISNTREYKTAPWGVD